MKKDEIIPYGRIGRVDFMKIVNRLKDKPDGKYIEVTAITPTPLGEGKTTTSMGLIEGLGKRGQNVGGAIRQPSGGPTMNIKGSAAGGGNAQAIPLTEFSLGLTGDINNIINAHNLAMVALTSRMQHERNYSDEELAKRRLKRLDVDPKNVQLGLDHRFLRPDSEKHRHRSRRQDGRFPYAVQIRYRRQFRSHGYSVYCQRPEGLEGATGQYHRCLMTNRAGRLQRVISKWQVPWRHS